MKKILSSALILAVLTALLGSCGNPEQSATTVALTEKSSTEESTTEEKTTAEITTQGITAPITTEKPTASTTRPPDTAKKNPEENTTAAKHGDSTTHKSTECLTTAPQTSALPVSGTVNSSTVISDETRHSGHYNNDINAYYSGNVLVCGDYGMEYFSLSTSGNTAYAAAVNAFARKYPSLDVSCMLVPKCATFYAPSGYADMYENHSAFVNATYAMLDSGIKKPDCLTVFNEHRGEYMFYRTDHHWTSLGAYYASTAYCKANSITPRELTSYNAVVNTGYIGSLYSFCASPKPASLKTNPDYTVGHLPEAQYSMKYISISGQWTTGPVIDTTAKSYAGMFMCGDEPFAVITTSAGTGKKLLVFKESYGNAFVPFMIDYYDEIVVIDIRHFSASTASVISDYGITHALIINNLQGAGSLVSQLKSRLGS